MHRPQRFAGHSTLCLLATSPLAWDARQASAASSFASRQAEVLATAEFTDQQNAVHQLNELTRPPSAGQSRGRLVCRLPRQNPDHPDADVLSGPRRNRCRPAQPPNELEQGLGAWAAHRGHSGTGGCRPWSRKGSWPTGSASRVTASPCPQSLVIANTDG